MKFPHVFRGAVASSAPVLLFEDISTIQNSFFKITTDTYKRYDESCPADIRSGFKKLADLRSSAALAANPSVLSVLTQEKNSPACTIHDWRCILANDPCSHLSTRECTSRSCKHFWEAKLSYDTTFDHFFPLLVAVIYRYQLIAIYHDDLRMSKIQTLIFHAINENFWNTEHSWKITC